MQQWKDEIFNKTDGSLRTLIHHGNARTSGQSPCPAPPRNPANLPRASADWHKLRKYDVVITSYNTCASEWPDAKPKKGKGKGREGSAEPEELKPVAPKKSGPLFGGEFYRIM